MKNKRIITLLLLVLPLIVVSAGTYAWYVWQTNDNQNVSVSLTASSSITFNGGTDLVGELEPVLYKEDGIIKTISITSDTSGNNFNLYMKINSLPDELKSTSLLWAVYNDDEFINGDNFSTYNNNDNIVLLSDREISSNSTDTYTIYFWIDGNVLNNNNMMNETISLSLYATGEISSVNEIQD